MEQTKRRDVQPGSSGLTLSLRTSSRSSSLSLRAFASLCKSDGSLRSLLRESAAADVEWLVLADTKVLALSDISVASLLGREGGTFSGTLKWLSLSWQADGVSDCWPTSPDWWDCFCESSVPAAELSEETGLGSGWTLDCWLSSDGLRRLGDWSLRGAAARVWLAVSGPSSAFSGTSTGVSSLAFKGDFTAFTGDLVVRATVEGRLGITLGLTENRFLLWTAADEALPSVWSLPSLQKRGIYLH